MVPKQYFTFQLQKYIQSTNQRPVCKDVDVVVWQDFRQFGKLPKLPEAGKFWTYYNEKNQHKFTELF